MQSTRKAKETWLGKTSVAGRQQHARISHNTYQQAAKNSTQEASRYTEPRKSSDKAATKIRGQAGVVGQRAHSSGEERAPLKPTGTAPKVVPAPWPSYSHQSNASPEARASNKDKI